MSGRGALLAVFFGCLFAALTVPPPDGEFWWHLAFGRWIWEHRALPAADPFDCTSAVFGAGGQVRYQLTQYWLAQILLYGSHLLGGVAGAIALRAAVFTGLFFLLHRLLRRAGAGVAGATLLVALAFQAVVKEITYVSIRPQMWSSLLFVALLLLLEHLREGRRWARYALPPFMLLWANLHAGFVLGLLVIAVAVATAFVTRNPERLGIAISAALAAAATGLNPAGFQPLYAFQFWRLATPLGILEEGPIYEFVALRTLPREMPALTACVLLPFATLRPGRGALAAGRRERLLIFLGTLAMGIKATRYLVFLVPAACWMTALNLGAIRESLAAVAGPLRRALTPRAGAVATAAAILALSAAYARDAVQASALRPAALVPEPARGAADYLERNGLRGNLLNLYSQGGYLAWRLYPAMKIFIYGRMAYPDLLSLYDDLMQRPGKSLSIDADGRRTWFYQRVLDEHAVVAAVIPAGSALTGDVVPLAWSLAQDGAWALVHAEPEALVFLRRAGAPAALVAAPLPRSAFANNLIAVALAAGRADGPGSSPLWRRSLALGYLGRGQREVALRYFDEYLALAPEDGWARRLRADAAAGAALPEAWP